MATKVKSYLSFLMSSQNKGIKGFWNNLRAFCTTKILNQYGKPLVTYLKKNKGSELKSDPDARKLLLDFTNKLFRVRNLERPKQGGGVKRFSEEVEQKMGKKARGRQPITMDDLTRLILGAPASEEQAQEPDDAPPTFEEFKQSQQAPEEKKVSSPPNERKRAERKAQESFIRRLREETWIPTYEDYKSLTDAGIDLKSLDKPMAQALFQSFGGVEGDTLEEKLVNTYGSTGENTLRIMRLFGFQGNAEAPRAQPQAEDPVATPEGKRRVATDRTPTIRRPDVQPPSPDVKEIKIPIQEEKVLEGEDQKDEEFLRNDPNVPQGFVQWISSRLPMGMRFLANVVAMSALFPNRRLPAGVRKQLSPGVLGWITATAGTLYALWNATNGGNGEPNEEVVDEPTEGKYDNPPDADSNANRDPPSPPPRGRGDRRPAEGAVIFDSSDGVTDGIEEDEEVDQDKQPKQNTQVLPPQQTSGSRINTRPVQLAPQTGEPHLRPSYGLPTEKDYKEDLTGDKLQEKLTNEFVETFEEYSRLEERDGKNYLQKLGIAQEKLDNKIIYDKVYKIPYELAPIRSEDVKSKTVPLEPTTSGELPGMMNIRAPLPKPGVLHVNPGDYRTNALALDKKIDFPAPKVTLYDEYMDELELINMGVIDHFTAQEMFGTRPSLIF